MAATIPDAWEAGTEVAGAAWRVNPAILRAESRGRGPKPPKHAIEAKKVAVYLAVVLADCSYSDLGRHIGYHKDTVCSHCADVRLATDDVEFEERLQELEALAKARLTTPSARAVTFAPDLSTRELLLVVNAKLDRLLALGGLESVGGSSVHPTKPPTHEKKIIDLKARRSA